MSMRTEEEPIILFVCSSEFHTILRNKFQVYVLWELIFNGSIYYSRHGIKYYTPNIYYLS